MWIWFAPGTNAQAIVGAKLTVRPISSLASANLPSARYCAILALCSGVTFRHLHPVIIAAKANRTIAPHFLTFIHYIPFMPSFSSRRKDRAYPRSVLPLTVSTQFKEIKNLSSRSAEAVGIALNETRREETRMRSPARCRHSRNFLHFSGDCFAALQIDLSVRGWIEAFAALAACAIPISSRTMSFPVDSTGDNLYRTPLPKTWRIIALPPSECNRKPLLELRALKGAKQSVCKARSFATCKLQVGDNTQWQLTRLILCTNQA